jgi:hypothetical protein
MIEAVNIATVNAAVLRGSAEQVDVARSLAANPGRIQESASQPQAPYVSPYIFVDVNYNKAVLQIRNGDTGEVENQFPSESRLRLQIQASNDVVAAPRPQADVQQYSAPDVQVAAAPTVAPKASAPNPSSAQAQVAAAALNTAAQTSTTPAATTVSTTV